ncbi:MAG: hypothetical protein U0232_03185 [Thermomicrobiales bacterium]
MLTLETTIRVAGLRGHDVFDFLLLSCTDEQYRRWWPGTHLQFHTLRRYPQQVGNLVFMDEYIGHRRLRLRAIVVEAVRGERIVWQFRWGATLPAWLRLDLADDETGVTIRHTVRAGVGGIGRILDPLLRLYASPRFVRDLDAHVRTEFPKLRDLLADPAPALVGSATGRATSAATAGGQGT